ncbi:general transcriptional corepressor ssn6 [Fusarium denticulatum]|uniref:General transcriptional corepressor ssn6 n=1 Tax=Fusarium denticulatum TaxID=48507 RepID=A0A8H5X9J0_9HYPO|nr:general transcriptional corepressor ssn6 [Fusarium denticulatum]
MSFGYGVGDVIAVLGLFERIAIELRNYKDAPKQSQLLGAEIDLLRGTLKRVLYLEPECDAERETLEQIRAIVIYCAQPLQSMADKMRSKETSLRDFKTTTSLRSIGTRLHWSMIALDEVQELRKTVMSQMAAINVLLSVLQQLASHQPGRYQTAESFKEILQSVVYPKERPGAKYMANNLFAVAQVKTGKEVNQETWETMIKPGFHLEQAVVLKMNYCLERCLDPDCNGTLVDQVLDFGSRQVCNICSRSSKTKFVKTRVVDLYNEAPYSHDPVERFASLTAKPCCRTRISGLATLSPVEGIHYENPVEDAREHLETSVKLDSSIPENWYLLSRACMMAEDYERAYQCLQNAISLVSCCPSFWITLGILYLKIGQSRDYPDALTKAVELNAHIWEPWYNLGVLHDSCNGQHSDAADAFYKCLERMPELSNVRARLEAHQAYTEDMNDEHLGGHIFLRFKNSISGEQIVRPYTPIAARCESGEVDLVVKIYHDKDTMKGGKMTTTIDFAAMGSLVELKGPISNFEYTGQGTAPSRAGTSDASDSTECLLLSGNRSEDDVLCKDQLDTLASQNDPRFQVMYTLSSPCDGWTGYRGRLGAKLLAAEVGDPTPGTAEIVLLCGPPAMEAAVIELLSKKGWKDRDIVRF